MIRSDIERLGAVLEKWVQDAPSPNDVDNVTRDAQDALIEAGMVQFNPNGWDFKLHEKHPDAPRAQFKLMIREAAGVDTNPAYYDRFVLPSVLHAEESGSLEGVDYIIGYPNAGTPIAAAFVRLAGVHLGVDLKQLIQGKVTHIDGKRELGDITSEYEKGGLARAVDDTATGGDTKIEGWRKITQHGLGYAGLSLMVERDPLGSALVRERTSADVSASIHWMTLVQHAARVLDLPADAVRQELGYPDRLFEWNVANGKTGSLPNPDLIQ